MLLFVAAHKLCDGFVLDLDSDVVVCCCSLSVKLFCVLTWFCNLLVSCFSHSIYCFVFLPGL